MRIGPFEISSARTYRRRVVGFLALLILGPPAILFCCVCGPIVSLFVTTDLERANQLWDEGRREEAIELYEVALPSAMRPDPLALKRVIEWSWEHEDEAQALRFCELAAEKSVKLSLSPAELHERYEESVERFAESETTRIEEERRLREYEDAEGRKSTDFAGAWVAAQRYVEARIDRGSTADFGDVGRDYQNPEERIEPLGAHRYEATGWVDVTDASGNAQRIDFRMILKENFVDRTWSLDEEPVLTPRAGETVEPAKPSGE